MAQSTSTPLESGPQVLQLPNLVRRWLREPLLHFLLFGALIFAAYELLHPEANRPDQVNKVVLTKDDLRQLAVHWLAQGRPAPTADQMRELMEDRVHEEILSREAIALGLDKDDEVIKRRLMQKMDFLAADVAALQNPSHAELADWYAQNADRFALAPRASFRHLYFSFDRPNARDRAGVALGKIVGKPADAPEAAMLADPFMFQDYYAERSPDQIAREFGPGFSKALFELKTGVWAGPVQSGYGWHLVFVDAVQPRRLPALEEVEPDVKSAWLDQKQREIKHLAYEAMRARYTVVVPPLESVDFGSLGNPNAPIGSTDVFPQ